MFADRMTVIGYEYDFTCVSVCLLMFLCIQEALKRGISVYMRKILSLDVDT